ncbi:MAG: glycosyl transferase family protein [Acidobacteria bacterium]|nr:glycosyl transferase family protein [Acidobacteriota bacterium]
MDFNLQSVDEVVRSLILPLAAWIFLSGIDDLFLDAVCLLTWLSRQTLHSVQEDEAERKEALAAPQKRTAILVPLWREDAVIRQMVDHNVDRIDYRAYDFFLGAYPNDEPTLGAVRELEARHPNVHVSVCANPGPTSKADCLNWAFQRMVEFERDRNVRFEVILTHDAEDVIHEHALHWINYCADIYDMVQVPVLPLPTPISKWTHGIYCDEFAEFQTKDMPGRQILNGFVPSNGVGTGFTRWALDRLAKENGRIFEPESLTEDYENGLRLHYLGCPQLFVPVRMLQGRPVATREFFPQTVRSAIKQRTRWVTGISLQSWERHGWKGGLGTRYWLWRDRKGLIGNPVSFLTTLLFFYGLGTWCWSRWFGGTWGLGAITANVPALLLMGSNTAIQVVHLGVRAWCSARVYGWWFASGVPVRAILANYINFRATLGAIRRYAAARLGIAKLVWLKTDHRYPMMPATAVAAARNPMRLGEVLMSAGRLTANQLAWAIANKPPEERIGEFLVRCRLVTEEQVYQGLSQQGSIPLAGLDPRRVRSGVVRALPLQVALEHKVIPFQVAGGFLFIACCDIPQEGLERELAAHTKLHVRVHLVTQSNFNRLREALFPGGAAKVATPIATAAKVTQ